MHAVLATSIELRRLPEQFRIIARCMRDERCKRGRGGADLKAKASGGLPDKRRSEMRQLAADSADRSVEGAESDEL